MKTFAKSLFLFVLFFGLAGGGGMACTTFQLNHTGQIFVGKNYDYMVEDALIIVNRRGVSKTAMRSIFDNSGIGSPATWTSKYGSITINQYGREVPTAGMNEAGLVVESMMLLKSRYPEPDARPSVLLNQWMQYQLDNFTSVDEVIASDSQLRIRPRQGSGLHYLISDQKGNCAVIEFIEGKMVCHANDEMPYKVLTNSVYTTSIEHLEKGVLPEGDRIKSIERFIRGADMVKSYKPGVSKPPLDYAFDILKSVSWSGEGKWKEFTWTTNTKWSVVWDLQNLRVYFRTLENRKIRNFDLASFDFSCGGPVKALDINRELSGDVASEFIDYTYRLNRNLVENALTKTPWFPKFSEEAIDSLSKYPETTACEGVKKEEPVVVSKAGAADVPVGQKKKGRDVTATDLSGKWKNVSFYDAIVDIKQENNQVIGDWDGSYAYGCKGRWFEGKITGDRIGGQRYLCSGSTESLLIKIKKDGNELIIKVKDFAGNDSWDKLERVAAKE